MLVQLHTQDPCEPSSTVMLMQGEVNSDEEAAEWFKLCAVKWEEKKDLRPDGWIPMVCTESSEHFVMAAAKPEDA